MAYNGISLPNFCPPSAPRWATFTKICVTGREGGRAEYCMKQRGWGGVAYNYFVESNIGDAD